ncbi:MAG: hypothetical protein NVS4B11_36550 [Ktedonobacteraceae bacterium]
MRIPMRLKLLMIVPVGVCLMLFMAFSVTTFASGVGTHPHLKGPGDATTTNGCIAIKIHGSDFTPSTTTTPNTAFIFTIADTDHTVFQQTTAPVDAKGNFSTTFTICGITALPDKIEYIAQDGISKFYTNTVYTKANK